MARGMERYTGKQMAVRLTAWWMDKHTENWDFIGVLLCMDPRNQLISIPDTFVLYKKVTDY